MYLLSCRISFYAYSIDSACFMWESCFYSLLDSMKLLRMLESYSSCMLIKLKGTALYYFLESIVVLRILDSWRSRSMDRIEAGTASLNRERLRCNNELVPWRSARRSNRFHLVSPTGAFERAQARWTASTPAATTPACSWCWTWRARGWCSPATHNTVPGSTC